MEVGGDVRFASGGFGTRSTVGFRLLMPGGPIGSIFPQR